jgi:hypothetical protein
MRRPVDQQGEGGGVFIPCKGIRRVLRKVREKTWVTGVKESDMKIWPLETSWALEVCRMSLGGAKTPQRGIRTGSLAHP